LPQKIECRQCARTVTGLGEQQHQRSRPVFVLRIQRNQQAGRADRFSQPPLVALGAADVFEQQQAALPEIAARQFQPFGKFRHVGKLHAFEKLPAERCRHRLDFLLPPRAGIRGIGNDPVEGRIGQQGDVHPQPVAGQQAHSLVVALQRRRAVCRIHHGAQVVEHLTQVGTGRRQLETGPQQVSQLFPRLPEAGMRRQVAEQGQPLAIFDAPGQHLTATQQLGLPEQLQLQRPIRGWPDRFRPLFALAFHCCQTLSRRPPSCA